MMKNSMYGLSVIPLKKAATLLEIPEKLIADAKPLAAATIIRIAAALTATFANRGVGLLNRAYLKNVNRKDDGV